MQRRKICFVTEDFYPNFIGGQGVYGYHLVTGIAHQEHGITVLAEARKGRKAFWQGLPAGRQGQKNIQVLLVPFCFGNQLLLAFLEYFYFLVRLRNIYFDIVHANQLSGFLFVLLKPKNVDKVIVSVHNTNYDMYQVTDSFVKRLLYRPLIWLERLMYRRANGLLFNSPDEEKLLINYYHIKEKPTKAIYLGVEPLKYTQLEQQQAITDIRRQLGITNDTKLVLYIGRLVKRKRVDTLLRALTILSQSNSKVTGIIIGEGRERQRLEEIAARNAHLLGFVKDTKPYFLASDVFVTVSEAEGGFLLSALEAASYSLPLIVSPSVAGFPIVEDGRNGYVVDPNDPNALAEKIMLVLAQSEKLGKDSLRIAKQFSWQRCTRETVQFYRTILGT